MSAKRGPGLFWNLIYRFLVSRFTVINNGFRLLIKFIVFFLCKNLIRLKLNEKEEDVLKIDGI